VRSDSEESSHHGRFRLPWHWTVASRMVRSQGKSSISSGSWISVFGIILGVTSLIVVLSITGGFEKAFQERILGFHPHLVVLDSPSRSFQEYREAVQMLKSIPEVKEVSPSTYNEMLVAGARGRAGISVKGLPVSGLKGLLEDGVEYEAELSLLQERPTVTGTPGNLKVSGMVAGTSWSILHVEGPRPLRVIRDLVIRPEPGRARVRLLWVGEGEGLWLNVGTERVWVTGSEASRGIELAPGSVQISREAPSSDETSWTTSVEVGESTLLVLGKNSVEKVPERLEALTYEGLAAFYREVNATGAEVTAGPILKVEGRLPGILLGKELWKKLALKSGDTISLASPLRGVDNKMTGPFGMAPTSTTFQAAGWFHSGYYEYDSRMGVVGYRTAQRILNRGDSVLWLDVRFHDVFQLDQKTTAVREALDPYNLVHFLESAAQLRDDLAQVADGTTGAIPASPSGEVTQTLANLVVTAQVGRTRDLNFGYKPRYKLLTWEEMNANLFGALKLQKVVLTVFFLIIIAVAAFNVVGSQIMLIHDKRTSIAILKAMGASESGIMRVFLIQGGVVSAIGTLVGLGLGLGVCFIILLVGYPLDPEVYLIDRLPIQITPALVAAVGVMAVLLTTATTLYSSARASRMSPIEGLRHLD